MSNVSNLLDDRQIRLACLKMATEVSRAGGGEANPVKLAEKYYAFVVRQSND